MTVSVAFNDHLFLLFIWVFVILSGIINISHSMVRDDDKLAYFLTGVAELVVALLVIML
jgi:hypothetical protein